MPLICQALLSAEPKKPCLQGVTSWGETSITRTRALSINQPPACPTPVGNRARVHFFFTKGFH